MSYLPPIVQGLLLLLVLPAAIFDWRQRRVPNWLSLVGVLLGVGLNALLYETPGLWTSLKGMGLGFVVYFVFYMMRGMGAGDVKLMAAVGAIVGFPNWLGVLFLTAVLGGIAAAILVLSKGRVRRTFENLWLILVSIRHGQAPYQDHPELDVGSEKALRLPHAVMIALGSVGFLIVADIWAPR